MRLDAERSSTYRIFAEYRADRPELQLEKRAAPALKVLLDATRSADDQFDDFSTARPDPVEAAERRNDYKLALDESMPKAKGNERQAARKRSPRSAATGDRERPAMPTTEFIMS